jgi:hypothetical protein
VYHLKPEYDWGPDKISGYMERKGILLAQSTAYRIIEEEGVSEHASAEAKTSLDIARNEEVGAHKVGEGCPKRPVAVRL